VRSDIHYEYTDENGARISATFANPTIEQAALLTWLAAERAWKSGERQRLFSQRRADAKAKEELAQKEREKQVLAEHEALVSNAKGLRRAVLVEHGPWFEQFSEEPYCSGCVVYGYDDAQHAKFPCKTYDLAEDWEDA
jgi:hypothetical protein